MRLPVVSLIERYARTLRFRRLLLLTAAVFGVDVVRSAHRDPNSPEVRPDRGA
jgi:hypothetical protein